MEKIIKILKNIKPDIDVTNNNLIDEEILDSIDGNVSTIWLGILPDL